MSAPLEIDSYTSWKKQFWFKFSPSLSSLHVLCTLSISVTLIYSQLLYTVCLPGRVAVNGFSWKTETENMWKSDIMAMSIFCIQSITLESVRTSLVTYVYVCVWQSSVQCTVSESETTTDAVLLYLACCSCSKCYCGACTVMLSFCFIFNRFFHMSDKTCKMLIKPRGSLWPCWNLVNVCGYFADIIKGNTGTNCIKSILLVPFCMASCRISCLAWSLEARELLVRNSFTF